MDFQLAPWLDARAREVERWLAARLEALDAPPRLREAMAYSLLAGGKRLRPAVALAAAEAVGVRARPAALEDLCCALEMVHTYSLIHDDLPAMDDDDLRRGRPTSHKVFGEAMAILAGDALLTDAFACLARGEEPVRLRLVRRLAGAAGSAGMVGGQVRDVTREAVGAGLEAVERVHLGKTAALFCCAAAGGAEAVGAAPEAVAQLERYGRAVGLAFQIADDILDEVGEAAALGKTTGKDRARDTATVPRAIGLDAARDRARALVDEALTAVSGFGAAAAPRLARARRVIDRQA